METITVAASAPHGSAFPTLWVVAVGMVVVAVIAWQIRSRRGRG